MDGFIEVENITRYRIPLSRLPVNDSMSAFEIEDIAID